MFEVQLLIINKFGKFLGAKVKLNEEQLETIKFQSKTFYNSVGFELTLEDGTFVVFPPEIVKDSILKVLSKKIDEDV